MASSPSRSPLPAPADSSSKSRTVPLLSSSLAPSYPTQGDPMEISPATSASTAPHYQNSPETELGQGRTDTNGLPKSSGSQNTTSYHPVGAAAAAQQPKVVQTAFIHKLYSMLEDPAIQHLISWSSSNESFVVSPCRDFTKVLAQYFKHTNMSSFVRQLNMYGFHKVSDVFHTGSPDTPMWEFKHGSGSFRKGDVAGLREIKRRPSRHTLINRDSFSGHKGNVYQPATPAENQPDLPDARMQHLEHTVYDVFGRLTRIEESHSLLSSKCQALTESLVRCHQWTNSMSHFIMSLAPDPDNVLHRSALNMQREVARQLDVVRALESSDESARRPYPPTIPPDTGPPLSPRQAPQDDNRRQSIVRTPVPAHVSHSPRRYGSVGTANASPSHHRPPATVQHGPHPLSSASSPPGPNLARRHTSADIRQHGWPTSGSSPFPSNAPSGPWSPSPHKAQATNSGDQNLRDMLAQYEMGRPRQQQPDLSRRSTPPLPSEPPLASQQDSASSIGVPKFPRPADASLPATRRSSMASNVHSLLNPTDTAERAENEDGLTGDDRKRKRLQ